MLIDNDKFVALLVENSGIEEEKVRGYISELITDIKSAFEEGEGYEIDGFGIFSQLGNNVLFIPSDELETEINYKYVGMEPLELPSGEAGSSDMDADYGEEKEEEKENPIQGILDSGIEEDQEDRYADVEDPFAELFSEIESDVEDEETSNSEPVMDEEDIEAVVEDEIDDETLEDVFQEISEEQKEEEELAEDDPVIEESLNLDEVESEEEGSDSKLNDFFDEETDEKKESHEPKVGPESWGIEAHKEEGQEGAFAGLFGEDSDKEEMITEDDIFGDSEEEAKNEEEEIDFSALEEDQENDFDDDPFAELHQEETDEEDFIPVVTNVSSEKSEPDTEEEASTVDTQDDKKKTKIPGSPRDERKGAPVVLYMVLAIFILGGTGYLLAYFGVININGITPSANNNSQVAQNRTQPPAQVIPDQGEDSNAQIESQSTENEEQTPTQLPEQPENTTVSDSEDQATENPTTSTENADMPQSQTDEQSRDIVPPRADEKWPDGEEKIITSATTAPDGNAIYGLKGDTTEAGNNGYTIVLYTLSKKSGVDAQQKMLSEAGYRVIIKQKPSDTYGILYRVSIGQFETLRDAAIGAEQVDSEILGNYIITKI